MKAKKLIILILVFLLTFLTGCWDKVEINERAFVLSIIADTNGGSEKKEEPNLDTLRKNMNIIFTIPIPSKIASSDGKAFINLEGTGGNIPEAIEDVAKRINRILFFGQIKLFSFGEGLLNDDKAFRETIDFLERNPEINRTLQVTMVKGDINDIVNVNPKIDKLLATYVTGIFKNGGQLTNIISVDLNEFLSSLRNDNRAVLPCVEIKGDAVEVKDMALIKDYNLLQIVDNKYIRGYACITNRLKTGRKIFEYDGKYVPFIINSSKCNIKLIDEKSLTYKGYVGVEGDIEDYSFGEDITKEELSNLQNELSQSFRLELLDTTKYFQENVGCDFLKIGDYTKKYHYNTYKKYENNWDEAFKNAKIDYDVKVYIRRIGTSR